MAVPAWRLPLTTTTTTTEPSTVQKPPKPAADAKLPPIWHRCPPRRGCVCENRSSFWMPVDDDDVPTDDSTATTTNTESAADCIPAWSALAEGVAVISLAERDDRFRAACNRLHTAGLCATAVFHRPRRPDPDEMRKAGIKRPGRLGCWQSHRAVSMAALDAGLRSILVLEDDFMILPDDKIATATKVRSAADCLRSLSTDECDMFLLGGLPIVGFPVWSRWRKLDAFRALAVCNHAYVARPPLMRKLASTTYIDQKRNRGGSEQPVDWFVTGCKQVCYAPQFIGQTCESASDISSLSDLSAKVVIAERLSLDDRLGPHFVRFVRDHPAVYEFGIYAVLPTLCLIILLIVFVRLYNRLF